MEQIVRVRETYPNGMAQVIHQRESACSGDCHKCSGCGAAKEFMIFDAVNHIGASKGDLVVIKGKMTWVGSSSMEVCVDTYVENQQGEHRRINNAHFMMVALDENDNPVRVPRLILKTDDEHLAWAHGEERRRIRIQRKKDKLDGI